MATGVVLSPEFYRELQDLIRWKRAFRVTGAKAFVNSAQSCTIAIGAPEVPNAPSLPPMVLWVLLTQSGGVAGSDSTTCTFTYDLYRLNDTGKAQKLNTGGVVAPLNSRLDNVQYYYGTEGVAIQDTAGGWHLYVFDEVPYFEDCAA